MAKNGPPTFEVLLVEDNPADVDLTLETFRKSRVHLHISVVEDGTEALAFVRQQAPYTEAPRPDLILLDLNLPDVDGFEVLEQIKHDPNLRRIPVIVLTTSTAQKDILRSYDLYANSYLAKPIEIDQFLTLVRMIEDFWLTLVRLPGKVKDK